MLRRTGFKRRAMPERKPVAPVRPVRRVAPTVIGAAALAQPKTEPRRNRRLLDLARGQPCLMRVPGVCQGGTETTVAAHSNMAAHGKGGARKADDIYSVWACAACHIGWLDQGRAPRAQKEAAFIAGHLRQVEQWRLLAADAATPPADRAAARWALDLLGATPVLGFGLEGAA